MIIRSLQGKDAEQVAKLIPQLTMNVVDAASLQARIRQLVHMEGCQYVVVEEEGRVVGFCGLVWYVIPSKGKVGWIEEVVVEQAHRRQGIATRLIEHVLQLAGQARLAQVKLTTSNPFASDLYQKFGFAKKEETLWIKKYY